MAGTGRTIKRLYTPSSSALSPEQPGQPICPSGYVRDFVSSPLCKNISLRRLVETVLLIPPSTSREGRIAIVTDAGLDAVDADALLTNGV
jgi:hypothetical protein